jgi:transposase
LASTFGKWSKKNESNCLTAGSNGLNRAAFKELQSRANGLLSDEQAVRHALSLEWSNGQVEGQVNRLKTIKRQMYGRANFDLLRARVLHQV